MFELVALRDGLHTLRDLETGETFHPVVGPMAEADAIHIAPLNLENRLTFDTLFTIWDVGLGAAANAVALLERLSAINRPFRGRLISFDRTLEPLHFALLHATKLVYPLPWMRHLKQLANEGATRIVFAHGGALDWHLCLEDFTNFPVAPPPDGVIFDPYSPAKNPAMWSLDFFSQLRLRLTRPAVLTSYSRSTAVRVTLLLAGFHVGIGSATGEKDQTTVASTDLSLLVYPLPSKWLDRVRMSTSARPIGSGEKGPILDSDLRRLESCPQFNIQT